MTAPERMLIDAVNVARDRISALAAERDDLRDALVLALTQRDTLQTEADLLRAEVHLLLVDDLR